MQPVSTSDLKNKLRNNFRDEHKIQWSDELLDEILCEAQREYALYSGSFVGRVDVVTADSPVLTLPEDFFQVVQVISPKGENIPLASYRYLAERYGDFRSHKGKEAKFFCFNFDTFGKYRIYPQLPAGTFAGTIIYKRLPSNDEWMAVNSNAIEQYALFQMYQFTNNKLAKNCFDAFIDEINREQHGKLNPGSKKISRTGVYF